MQFASPLSVKAPHYTQREPYAQSQPSSIIKLRSGGVKMSVERSHSPIDPTEVVIRRRITS